MAATPAAVHGTAPVVLQLVPALDEGGVERGTVDVARAIVAAGGRALVASRGGRLERDLARAGGELVRIDVGAKSPLSILRNAWRVAGVVRAEGVEVIHARSRAPAWAGLLAARRTGAVFVTTWHGVHSEGFPGKRLYNSVMARGRPVIAVSEHVAEAVRARHPFARPWLHVIHRGVDAALFDPAAVPAERVVRLAEAWGLLDDPRPVVLMPGRLSPWKGQDVFVEAAARLREGGGPEALFVLAGGDPESRAAREVEARAKAEGVGDIVRIAGHVRDMPAAYALCAVAVSASTRPEAFGRVAAEAQAMARPVVVSDHGGARETVVQGETGWRVRPGSPAALAAAIRDALELTPEARAAMGAAGRDRVRRLFSLEAMTGATLEVYARALEARAATGR